MLALLIKGLVFAAKSPKGRELIFVGLLGAVRAARSEEARRVATQVRRLVAGPGAHRVAEQAARASKHAVDAARKADYERRVKAVRRFVRQHRPL
jgi:hypothetical protein